MHNDSAALQDHCVYVGFELGTYMPQKSGALPITQHHHLLEADAVHYSTGYAIKFVIVNNNTGVR